MTFTVRQQPISHDVKCFFYSLIFIFVFQYLKMVHFAHISSTHFVSVSVYTSQSEEIASLKAIFFFMFRWTTEQFTAATNLCVIHHRWLVKRCPLCSVIKAQFQFKMRLVSLLLSLLRIANADITTTTSMFVLIWQ